MTNPMPLEPEHDKLLTRFELITSDAYTQEYIGNIVFWKGEKSPGTMKAALCAFIKKLREELVSEGEKRGERKMAETLKKEIENEIKLLRSAHCEDMKQARHSLAVQSGLNKVLHRIETQLKDL